MSEEEKKELEHIKKRAKYVSKNILGTNIFTTYDIHCVNILIKIIEKQQKEIEEIKKDKKALVKNYDKVLETFISKGKIKEKIKEYEDTYMISDIAEDGLKENYKLVIIVLQELLEK